MKGSLKKILAKLMEVERVSASYNVGLSGGSIFAYKIGGILIVSGYALPSDTTLNNNTVLATVSATPLFETFASPNGSNGANTRLKLGTDGKIRFEQAYNKTNVQWVSYTFVTIVGGGSA